MKKPVTFASSFRVKAVLCCSVAVLLTACGGTTDESVNQQLLADTMTNQTMEASSARTTGAIDAASATPETSAQDTAMPDAATPVVADSAAPAAPDPDPAPMEPATHASEGKASASSEFNLNGYLDASSSSDPSTQGTSATGSADSQQATQPPIA